MGTFLSGYGEDTYDHEGYPAQVLEDGSITATYSNEIRPRMTGQVVAACGCGWTGSARYSCPVPFDARPEALALAEWEISHARPALERARHDRAAGLARLLGVLADQHRAYLEILPPRPARRRRELLDGTLRLLAKATELARELRDQAAQPERETGR